MQIARSQIMKSMHHKLRNDVRAAGKWNADNKADENAINEAQ